MAGFFYIMHVNQKELFMKMNAAEIASYINNEVGMDIACPDGNNNVIIYARRDFHGDEIFFDDFLFVDDSIYPYINQRGFDAGNTPDFCTGVYAMMMEPDYGVGCFNPEGAHERKCKFDAATGIREFDMETLKNSVDGLKKALKVPESSKLTITDEIEFMDI